MKKTLLFMALLAIAGSAMAQSNALSVADIELPQNSEAALVVSFQLDAADTYTGYSFNLELPEELEFVMDEGTDVAFTKGSCHDASHSVTANLSEGLVKVAGLSLSSKPLVGTSGNLLTFTIKPKSAVIVGQTFTGSIKDILIVPIEGAKKNLSESSFTITIGEPVETRTVLDETSKTAPTAATGVDVRVKRTIKANDWSTICLPFAMSEAQVKAAFGEDVELADFIDYRYDDETITVNFEDVTDIEANHPYIIKVSSKVEEFTVDGVDIEPVDDPCVEYDNGQTGRRRHVYGGFYGTYQAQTELEEFALFLNSNLFWYSTGLTKMKAYRAYFYFEDILPEVEGAGSRIMMSFDNKNTSIKEHSNLKPQSSNLYDLQGRKVINPTNGLYIKNGKKIIK
jgi:hypothetical protein